MTKPINVLFSNLSLFTHQNEQQKKASEWLYILLHSEDIHDELFKMLSANGHL
jgi:hypothetical protein